MNVKIKWVIMHAQPVIKFMNRKPHLLTSKRNKNLDLRSSAQCESTSSYWLIGTITCYKCFLQLSTYSCLPRGYDLCRSFSPNAKKNYDNSDQHSYNNNNNYILPQIFRSTIGRMLVTCRSIMWR